MTQPTTNATHAKCKCSTTKRQRQHRVAKLAICSLGVLIIALMALIGPADGQADESGRSQLTPAEYTPYESKLNFTKKTNYTTGGMTPIFNFTHKLFDNLVPNKPAIPPGYIEIKNSDTLVLGKKVEQNDWRDLLYQYWGVLLWVGFLLLLIVIIPFIAVCYCCFCCCRRCKQGCPPCDRKKDGIKRFGCGFLLLLLMTGILFGIIIAFVTNKMIDNGLQETSDTMKRGAEDTCSYLRDVASHVEHLFIKNYQELDTHLVDIIKNVDKHMYDDLMDASEANVVKELKRILDNMEKAEKLMAEIEKLEKDLRFYSAQLRDGVRGVKRNVNYACTVLCGNRECLHFLKRTGIEFIDSAKCLHLDSLPDVNVTLKAIKEVRKNKTEVIPKDALERLKKVGEMIKAALDPIKPKLIRDVHKGSEEFRGQANKVRVTVDALISDIYLLTRNSANSFDDVYDRFGPDRNVVNLTVCIVLLVIFTLLVIALICGCCGRRRRGYRDDCCSKGTGASCLLLVMLLIFCVFSAITMVGLFYFVTGFVTYQGACAPLRDRENNTLFRQLDASIDLNRYLINNDTSKKVEPLRMSNVLDACSADDSIFKILRDHKLYDLQDLLAISIMSTNDPGKPIPTIFDEDLTKIDVLKNTEVKKLEILRDSNLSDYRSKKFTEHLCTQLTPTELPTMANQLKELRASLWSQWGIYDWARTSLYNEAFNLQRFNDEFVEKIKSIIEKMTSKLQQVDELILYNNQAFGQSIATLLKASQRADVFIKTQGKEYINGLGENLTDFLANQIETYARRVVQEGNNHVGRCQPLAYIYYRGVDLICYRLVDPMNGFWVGVLLCSLLFLPVLFVSHRLMCLYKKIDPYSAQAGVVEGGDYLYDAYSERDREHVPLANVPKKRRKAYERRREQQDYYEDASPGVSRGARSNGGGGGGGAGGSNGDAAAGSSNMRYNDVAPTHWDHEPPRYHNPPAAPPSSEYERPPPYYYPGASDQD
ncbi:prominin-like protein isoform X2 [Drosophila busckii]|uniref:prominin-like protein isoform X2 n=1 Tax=Drosophila busckii TaxID=30019 RepID=UPI00143347A4|nr:prominin-like protein isoform X2 [Drosophila busckii]